MDVISYLRILSSYKELLAIQTSVCLIIATGKRNYVFRKKKVFLS